MYVFVLVHGSWHDGSAWGEVIKHLESKGHKAFSPTIAGHGKGVDKNVNHAQCSQSISDYIVSEDLTDIILLGHSFGGTIISKVAETIPERIRRLIFLGAFVLNDGDSLLDNVPPQRREVLRKMNAVSEDNTTMLPFNVWREQFVNDADLKLAKSTYEHLSPEPFKPIVEKLDLKKFYSLDIPKSYINCTEDMPQGEWGRHPRMSNRLGLYRLVQMPGSHEVLLTNPKGLADKIIEAGRD